MRLERAQHTVSAHATRVFGLLPRLLFVFLATAVSLMPPATVLAQQSAQMRAQTTKPVKAIATEDDSIRPFRIKATEEALIDLRRRIAATRWPDQETVSDRSQGMQLATMKELIRYWGTDYDWRKAEAKLNALPQFVTTIDGVDIHFIHVRSRHPNALPLIMTHGWPGSVFELLKTVGPLTDPTQYSGRAEDAFDLILPSMPGYGFSGRPQVTGWNPDRIARAWAVLMERLGYKRYVAQGGDWGSVIADKMAKQAPQGLLGIHINMPATVPPEVAKVLACGHDLILVARNREGLEALATQLAEDTGRSVEVIVADLSDRADLARVEQVLLSDPGITVLVNNAGIAMISDMADADPDLLESMLKLNVVAPSRLAIAALPGFIARGRGTIINMSSIAALAPELLNGGYSGTKAYLLALSLRLQQEVAGKGVRVQVVLPGATRTPIWEKAGTDIESLPPNMVMDVDEMVDAAIAGLDRGEQVTIPSLPDIADWEAYEAARQNLKPKLSLSTPAPRYGVPTLNAVGGS